MNHGRSSAVTKAQSKDEKSFAMLACHGFEILCSDGKVRCFPYHNEGDAACDAHVFSTRGGCDPWMEIEMEPCPGGEHTVRSVAFVHREHDERGQS